MARVAVCAAMAMLIAGVAAVAGLPSEPIQPWTTPSLFSPQRIGSMPPAAVVLNKLNTLVVATPLDGENATFQISGVDLASGATLWSLSVERGGVASLTAAPSALAAGGPVSLPTAALTSYVIAHMSDDSTRGIAVTRQPPLAAGVAAGSGALVWASAGANAAVFSSVFAPVPFPTDNGGAFFFTANGSVLAAWPVTTAFATGLVYTLPASAGYLAQQPVLTAAGLLVLVTSSTTFTINVNALISPSSPLTTTLPPGLATTNLSLPLSPMPLAFVGNQWLYGPALADPFCVAGRSLTAAPDGTNATGFLSLSVRASSGWVWGTTGQRAPALVALQPSGANFVVVGGTAAFLVSATSGLVSGAVANAGGGAPSASANPLSLLAADPARHRAYFYDPVAAAATGVFDVAALSTGNTVSWLWNVSLPLKGAPGKAAAAPQIAFVDPATGEIVLGVLGVAREVPLAVPASVIVVRLSGDSGAVVETLGGFDPSVVLSGAFPVAPPASKQRPTVVLAFGDGTGTSLLNASVGVLAASFVSSIDGTVTVPPVYSADGSAFFVATTTALFACDAATGVLRWRQATIPAVSGLVVAGAAAPTLLYAFVLAGAVPPGAPAGAPGAATAQLLLINTAASGNVSAVVELDPVGCRASGTVPEYHADAATGNLFLFFAGSGFIAGGGCLLRVESVTSALQSVSVPSSTGVITAGAFGPATSSAIVLIGDLGAVFVASKDGVAFGNTSQLPAPSVITPSTLGPIAMATVARRGAVAAVVVTDDEGRYLSLCTLPSTTSTAATALATAVPSPLILTSAYRPTALSTAFSFYGYSYLVSDDDVSSLVRLDSVPAGGGTPSIKWAVNVTALLRPTDRPTVHMIQAIPVPAISPDGVFVFASRFGVAAVTFDGVYTWGSTTVYGCVSVAIANGVAYASCWSPNPGVYGFDLYSGAVLVVNPSPKGAPLLPSGLVSSPALPSSGLFGVPSTTAIFVSGSQSAVNELALSPPPYDFLPRALPPWPAAATPALDGGTRVWILGLVLGVIVASMILFVVRFVARKDPPRAPTAGEYLAMRPTLHEEL